MSGWTQATHRTMAAVVLAVACLAVACDSAGARQKHRRHGAMQGEPKRPPIPRAYSFYPEEIEDGVAGNLPFNNQIRKFKDPLNANGGR